MHVPGLLLLFYIWLTQSRGPMIGWPPDILFFKFPGSRTRNWELDWLQFFLVWEPWVHNSTLFTIRTFRTPPLPPKSKEAQYTGGK